MDLIRSAVNLKQAELTSQVQIAVAKKILDQDRMNGAAAIKLLNAATQGASASGDALVAAATGLGGELDTYA